LSNPNVYLNGAFIPAEQARVSVMDRGFLFGDGVYEVIPCYGGRLFRLPHHLQRLDSSLAGIKMSNPLTYEQWRQLLETLVAQLPNSDQAVYLQVTRGAAGKRDHRIPEGVEPTVFAMTTPLTPPDPKLVEQGISATTQQDIRWNRCNIKAITLLANVLLREEATQQAADEAILIRDGLATEGAASNLFVVSAGVIRTPPTGPQLLPGITRDLVLELAAAHGLPSREEAIAKQALFEADELWITSSTREIVPVTRLNGHPVGNGHPGPIFRRVYQLYRDYKQRLQQGLIAE